MRPLRLLVLVLVVAAPVRAEDACLQGDSTLSDQRAFATLRADTETACPCASFTGRRGHTRAAYQKCAKRTLQEALAKDTLREACRKAAINVNRGASCGNRKAAPCGELRTAAGKPPVSCTVKSNARCKDRRGVTAESCTAETHCADVVDWTAGTCFDPRHQGPYGVGVRVLHLVKKSFLHPSDDRVLDTVVWYPAPASVTGPIDDFYKGVLDAPVEHSGAPYPLLMFSHGSCGYAAQSTFLHPLLASYGFIVVSPPHPGNTLFDGFPACQADLGSSANERPHDITFALDSMLAANGDGASPFSGTIDPDRIGMSGHSFGGFTVFLVAGDPRFKAAVAMAPFTLGSQMASIPLMMMYGPFDSAVPLPALKQVYENSSEPKFLIEIGATGHYAFSDACFPSPDCMPPKTLTQEEAHALVLRWELPFLEVYLAGDQRWAPLLTTPPPPGVTVQHAP